jgi:hypothetical protein
MKSENDSMSSSSDQTPVDPAPDVMSELRARADTLERQLAELQRHTEARLIRAELKAEAVRAGMIDLDGLRLIDLPSLKLNERGEVEGGSALMQDLRKSKPWLFGSQPQSSSSSSSIPPPAMPQKQKLATEMSDAEYRAARAAILKHRS